MGFFGYGGVCIVYGVVVEFFLCVRWGRDVRCLGFIV